MSEFNPVKITVLRDLKGWTIEQLSEISDVPKRRISDISRSLVEFRLNDAEAFASASGFPLSFFTLPDEPAPATELTFRAPSRTSTREKKRVSSEYRELNNVTHRVAVAAGFENKSNWIDSIAPVNSPVMDDIEELATEARLRVGLPALGPVNNVTWSLEAGGVIIAPMTMTPENENARPEGVSFPASASQPATIGYFSGRRSGDGIRFTIAHEFGHLLLQRKRKPLSRLIIEREASQFAGAFLIPRRDALSVFSPYMTLDDYKPVKAQYGVSIAALIMRARQVGVIDKDRQRSLMTQMSVRHWRRTEPVEVDEEHPVLFKQLLGKIYGRVNSATDIEIDQPLAEHFTGMPLEYLNIWAEGVKTIPHTWEISSFMRH